MNFYRKIFLCFIICFILFYNSFSEVDSNTKASLNRLLKIWEERSIYDKNQISSFKQALHPDGNNGKSESKNGKSEGQVEKSKSRKRENEDSNENGSASKKLLGEQLDTKTLNSIMPKISSGLVDVEVDMEKYTKVEPDKFIKTMKELENCASADESARQKIASFPSEVFDVKLMESVVNQESAAQWSQMVEEAQTVLTSYNSRLAKELEERKLLFTMLAYYVEGQRRALTHAEQSLTEYRDKLRKVNSVREELNSHLQNLPDLSQLPSVTPLPSALDLFKL